jgi:AraC family transcriptional regulator
VYRAHRRFNSKLMPRYQDIYPSPPLLRSADHARPSAADLLSLEYFEAEPATMPELVFDQHHVLLNLRDDPLRVENWRDGEHRDFIYRKYEITVTPAGVRSGWRWHETSKVIVITLDPAKFERFAQSELGLLLTARQLRDLPQFRDEDIVTAGEMLLDALRNRAAGSAVMFESLARVFLIKLIQKYGLERADYEFTSSFTARHYQRVLDHIAAHYAEELTVEDLARRAGLSEFHFSRLFKRTIGRSPHQFILSYRVEQGTRLLADRDRPLADIALICGFADQAHFARSFKKFTGATPREYRRKLHAER